jgi:hypothetical protein
MEAIIHQVNTSPETVDWKALSVTLSSINLDSDYYKFVRFIKRNIDKPWDWNLVSYRFMPIDLARSITFDTILSNPDVDWPWDIITEEFLCYLPLEKFTETRHLNWDWRVISKTFCHIDSLEKLQILCDCPLRWDIISKNINEIIKNQVVNLDDLPQGYFVTDYFDKFLNYLDYPWDWSIITSGLCQDKKDKLVEKLVI